jgi:hypothetical protein
VVRQVHITRGHGLTLRLLRRLPFESVRMIFEVPPDEA